MITRIVFLSAHDRIRRRDRPHVRNIARKHTTMSEWIMHSVTERHRACMRQICAKFDVCHIFLDLFSFSFFPSLPPPPPPPPGPSLLAPRPTQLPDPSSLPRGPPCCLRGPLSLSPTEPLPTYYQTNFEFNINETSEAEGTADHVTLLRLLLLLEASSHLYMRDPH